MVTEGTQATITNLTGDGCVTVEFTATFDGDQFELLKPDGEQVRLRIDLNAWNPEPAHNPVPATTVKPPLAGEPGVWCNGTPTSFSMPGAPGVHSWCLITQSTQLAGTSGSVQQMQVYESWLLEGDALACRTCK